ncbi:MAG: hypothetical protein AVDCRST_MAG21-92 [uncultured Nocardioidaceae bacterium]|uniref:Nudix hydrolase domain-containing protein n=1 Tax=uncultured Nocardioidaceae bacterium TaxID=253824 RepID=A0A6J4MS20_9ACTN|nr:MAG: hypothetical protein AVDCRST_MAG21-92 [uncultured Nocardioidaceae bacterium]
MRHRIRGAAVVVHEGRLLLARHDDRKRGLSWWSPPGGGVEGEEDILASAAREAEEETSLRVVPVRPVYGQELIDRRRSNRTLEYFVLCELAAGASPDELRAANEIAEARWVDRAASTELLVLPDVFATAFWDDLAAGFPTFRHLGITVIGNGAKPG